MAGDDHRIKITRVNMRVLNMDQFGLPTIEPFDG